jgi:hypothetical protein
LVKLLVAPDARWPLSGMTASAWKACSGTSRSSWPTANRSA